MRLSVRGLHCLKEQSCRLRSPHRNAASKTWSLPDAAGGHADGKNRSGLSAGADAAGKHGGRLIFNGFPTGVEVNPVCWQDAPSALLPTAPRDDNLDKIWRLLDSRWTQEPIQ